MLCLLNISISSFMYLFGALMLTTSTYVSSQVMRIIKSSSLAPLRFLKQMSCIHIYLLNRGEYNLVQPQNHQLNRVLYAFRLGSVIVKMAQSNRTKILRFSFEQLGMPIIKFISFLAHLIL